MNRSWPVASPVSRLTAALLVTALTAVLATVTLDSSTAAPSAKGKTRHSRPNVLVIMSDDQTVESQRVMRGVNRRIGGRGASFRNSFVSNPLCCPSRAAFLTGQYSRNNGVLDNRPPDGGYAGLNHANTLPVWLQDSGYYTALIGKYLNGYETRPQPQTIPPGWTNWQGTTRTYAYYDYRLNQNGTLVDYGHAPADYQTDVFTRKAVDVIQRRAGKRRPWFMWLTYLAPHSGGPNPNLNPPFGCDGTAKPAPRHADAFESAPLPQPPSFNEGDVSDKPAFIAAKPSLDNGDIDQIKRQYRCRLASLLALDEGVDRIIDALRDSGQLSNTYVIYTSDNGWFAGEHRIPSGKRKLYEPSIRVPLLIRGPGIEPGTTVRDLAINTDLAPTIAKLAGAKPRRVMDGRSLRSRWRHPGSREGRELLLNGTRRPVTGLRTARYLFTRIYTGEHELYDLRADPDELTNVYDDPAYARARAALGTEFAHLRHCAGVRCRPRPGVILHARRRHGPGRPCTRAVTAVRALRADGGIAAVSFRAGAGAARVRDTKPPFLIRIGPQQRAGGVVRIDATVDLDDGRRVTTRRTFRRC